MLGYGWGQKESHKGEMLCACRLLAEDCIPVESGLQELSKQLMAASYS